MITLPTLRGIPPMLSPSRIDSLAARYALALTSDGPIAAPASRKHTLEHGVLVRELQAWLDKATEGLHIFRPRVHVLVGPPPAGSCECLLNTKAPVVTIWLANANGDNWDSRWTLEQRWGEIERRHKGLAQTALAVLHDAQWYGVPILTPTVALSMAQFAWWANEEDERFVLEMNGQEPEPGDEDMGEERDGIPRRAWFDKVLPREATCGRRIVRDSTLQYTGALGRQILELRRATQAARRRKHRFEMHTQADDLFCVGYGATLRWNTRDPIPRVYDDHANGLYESYHVESAWGWFVLKQPADLPVLLREIGERITFARLTEDLLESIAERSTQ